MEGKGREGKGREGRGAPRSHVVPHRFPWASYGLEYHVVPW
jgi:hypothetical protein